MLKIGLIGVGRWGKVYLKTINNTPSCWINIILSKNTEVNQLINNPCKVVRTSSAFFSEEMDGVIIATPPKSHLEFIETAAEKKIPILVEKPLTANLEQALSVDEIAKKNGSLIMVDHTHVFSHAFQVLKNEINNLGGIYEIETYAGNYGPYREDVSVLWDWSPHDISMVLDLLNASSNDVIVMSYQLKTEGFTSLQETIRIKLNIKNTMVRIWISNHTQKTRRFRVHCKNGMVEYDDLKEEKVVVIYNNLNKLSSNKKVKSCIVKDVKPLDLVIKKFVNLIENKVNHHESLNLGLEVVRTITKIETSKSYRL